MVHVRAPFKKCMFVPVACSARSCPTEFCAVGPPQPVQNSTEQNRTEQSRAEQSRAEQSREKDSTWVTGLPTGPADLQGSTEHLVDVVGDGLVLERHGVRVVAQCGRGIPVPEAAGPAAARPVRRGRLPHCGADDANWPWGFRPSGRVRPTSCRVRPRSTACGGCPRGKQPRAEGGAVVKPTGPCVLTNRSTRPIRVHPSHPWPRRRRAVRPTLSMSSGVGGSMSIVCRMARAVRSAPATSSISIL
jgi:hypothetical protein